MRVLFNEILILWEKFYNLKIVDDSTANLNDSWNFGSMALICLFIKIVIIWIVDNLIIGLYGFFNRIFVICFNYCSNKNEYCKNFIIVENKDLSQKKFYPNPNQIFRICSSAVSYKNCNPVFNNKKTISGKSSRTVSIENNFTKGHSQEHVAVFNVEQEQQCYAMTYERKNNVIMIERNCKIEKELDKEIIENSYLIIDNLEKMGIAKENIKFVNNQFENYKKTKNSGSIYTKTVGYSKNNLTTKPNYNFTAIYEISPKKSLFPYYKKGLIQINRNDLDFMRSITDYTMNYKDTNLKNYKINEEHVQEHTRNILNDIGGYKNIEFYDNIKTRQKMLELTICMWIYLKNKQNK